MGIRTIGIKRIGLRSPIGTGTASPQSWSSVIGALPFVTTWQTENAGSATKTVVIPTTGAGYDCFIDWGDGGARESQSGTPGNISHTYATTGVKTVSIYGVFPRIYLKKGLQKE